MVAVAAVPPTMVGGGAGILDRHGQAAHRHIGPAVDMLLQHDLVVHLVDMVARKDDHVFHAIAVDDVDVLGHSVGGAQVPGVLVHPLGGGQDIKVFVALGTKEVPATLHVADQGMGLVLGQYTHSTNTGINAIGQGEIDDAELTAERNPRFGAPISQILECYCSNRPL